MTIAEASLVSTRLENLARSLENAEISKSVKKVTLIYTSWYPEVVEELVKSARQYLLQNAKISPQAISEKQVPGSFEIPLTCQQEFESGADICIALGCVVRGETPHFQFICSALSEGVMNVQLKYNRPIGFGVLTVANIEQALKRKDKGKEAAEAAWITFLRSHQAGVQV